MKKYLIIVACALAIVGCKQKQGQTTGDAAETDSVQTEVKDVAEKLFTPAEIGSGWATKDINVEKGGEQPDIMVLLKAFAKVWPTETVNLLVGMAADGIGQNINRDTGGGMLIDYNNGYVDVMPGDAPGDVLHGAIWKRSNGHRLLGLNIFTPMSDDAGKASAEVLCFYDYDPKTETMTPEKDNAIIQFKPSKGNFARYEFPRLGRDMLVGDSDAEYQATWHVFAWDGKTFKEEIAYTDSELQKGIVGLWKSTDKNVLLTFRITADEDGWPTITDCALEGSTDYEARVFCDNGLMGVSEQEPKGYYDNDEEETPEFTPSLVCQFHPTKNGKLTGGYIIKQKDKDRCGIMTMEKQSQLNDYAE